MENPTRLQHLKSSIETLEELSNELASRRDGWNENDGNLDASSDALKRFCSTLRSRYEHILADRETDESDPYIPNVRSDSLHS